MCFETREVEKKEKHFRMSTCFIYFIGNEVSAVIDGVDKLSPEFPDGSLSIFVNKSSEHDLWLFPRT